MFPGTAQLPASATMVGAHRATRTPPRPGAPRRSTDDLARRTEKRAGEGSTADARGRRRPLQRALPRRRPGGHRGQAARAAGEADGEGAAPETDPVDEVRIANRATAGRWRPWISWPRRWWPDPLPRVADRAWCRAVALGAYLGSVARDWRDRRQIRRIAFRREFGADLRHLDAHAAGRRGNGKWRSSPPA